MGRLLLKSVDLSMRYPRIVIILTVLITLFFLSFFPAVKIDTDPENMLSADEPIRVFHNQVKKEFGINEMIVLGIVRDDGIFHPDTLKRIADLTERVMRLKGVIAEDVLSLTVTNNVVARNGVLNVRPPLYQIPQNSEEIDRLRKEVIQNPLFRDRLVSADGTGAAIYIPIESKEIAHEIGAEIRKIYEKEQGPEKYYMAGLPIAEDTFGAEMFRQMAVVAPLAGGLLMLILLIIFRRFTLVLPAMIISMLSVIWTMGAMIGLGFTVHIMSSMIPVFLMPIAVCDSVHVLSDFYEKYPLLRNKRKALSEVFKELYKPMLYTSLTTAVGFANLAWAKIPPVRLFGLFIALGVIFAWILTMTFIPASLMLIKEKRLEKLAKKKERSRILAALAGVSLRRSKAVVIFGALLLVVAIYGVTTLRVNDNPVKWFTKSHPIRVADKILNEHFGGTYMAYLALSAEDKEFNSKDFVADFNKQTEAQIEKLKIDLPQTVKVFAKLKTIASDSAKSAKSRKEVFEKIAQLVTDKLNQATDDTIDTWNEASLFVDQQKQRNQLFKDPAVLKYQAKLQQALLKTDIVGKSNSLADIIKTVHRELFEGKTEQYRIPDSSSAVAQCMLTYQSSHRPGDLWHFVTPDYRKSSIWVQLKSGDNKDMTEVVRAMDNYIAKNPPPVPLKYEWFGLTYINIIWQHKMVLGMLQAFIGSFLVVFLMMTILFRSALWGLLSMIPLTVTIGAIYGVVGLIGKDYDMPVAVLSSMALGLAVDFAIHFLARSRQMYSSFGTWKKTVPAIFAEPARAISRNVIVIAVGFLPLLLAPLTPYNTVGTLLASILLVSGVATLLILPALIRILERRLFPDRKVLGPTCNCVTCLVSSAALVALIAVNLHQYAGIGYNKLIWISVVAIPVMALSCGLMSRRKKCKILNETEATKND